MRRTLLTLAIVVLAAVGLGGVALATSNGSAITRPRLEDSVQAAFSNVYSQEAALLGHKGVTPASMRARTYCDKGPDIPQNGPGASWNCLVSWHDPAVPMPSTGYGKLEVTVHTNGCYTVSAPSTLVGYQTITDARGRTVNNPAYAFDGCINPDGDNTPNGVTFPPELKITNTTAALDGQRHTGVDLACGPGAGGCTGTVTASSGGRTLGTVHYAMTEQATTHLTFPTPVPAGAKDVTYTAKGGHQVLPSATDLPIQP
jgi:hypothetical protein